MKPLTNAPLSNYSTMHLGGPAAYLMEVHSRQELGDIIGAARKHSLPVIMIGTGSNIVWKDEGFPGVVLVNKIERYEDFAEDDMNHYLTIGAGENWDSVVARSTAAGLTGIEALSLIPGTAGATPVQNVGAYGQEIADTLVSVEAYDTQTNSLVNIPAMDCAFGYRTSRFKTTDRGRFLITAITLHLTKGTMLPPFYTSLQQYLDENKISNRRPQTIRDAVIAIRSSKLPDPTKVANNGSFFANPVVSEATLFQLSDTYANIPSWKTSDGRIKLSAAWLLEQAGFKDFHDPETGMATWWGQPLVLINEHATSAAQAVAFRDKIVQAVQQKFQITLEQEPELLP